MASGRAPSRSISNETDKQHVREQEEEVSDSDNNSNGAEEKEELEDEGSAISEKRMRELAKSVAAGKVLDFADAHALRRALDEYRGPNKPDIDLFLLTKDVLQSKYHAKTYTQPMGGGIKATPNGAVELCKSS